MADIRTTLKALSSNYINDNGDIPASRHRAVNDAIIDNLATIDEISSIKYGLSYVWNTIELPSDNPDGYITGNLNEKGLVTSTGKIYICTSSPSGNTWLEYADISDEPVDITTKADKILNTTTTDNGTILVAVSQELDGTPGDGFGNISLGTKKINDLIAIKPVYPAPSGVVAGNLAIFTSTGDIEDTGIKSSDLITIPSQLYEVSFKEAIETFTYGGGSSDTFTLHNKIMNTTNVLVFNEHVPLTNGEVSWINDGTSKLVTVTPQIPLEEGDIIHIYYKYLYNDLSTTSYTITIDNEGYTYTGNILTVSFDATNPETSSQTGNFLIELTDGTIEQPPITKVITVPLSSVETINITYTGLPEGNYTATITDLTSTTILTVPITITTPAANITYNADLDLVENNGTIIATQTVSNDGDLGELVTVYFSADGGTTVEGVQMDVPANSQITFTWYYTPSTPATYTINTYEDLAHTLDIDNLQIIIAAEPVAILATNYPYYYTYLNGVFNASGRMSSATATVFLGRNPSDSTKISKYAFSFDVSNVSTASVVTITYKMWTATAQSTSFQAFLYGSGTDLSYLTDAGFVAWNKAGTDVTDTVVQGSSIITITLNAAGISHINSNNIFTVLLEANSSANSCGTCQYNTVTLNIS